MAASVRTAKARHGTADYFLVMSDSAQRMLLLFGVIMVAIIGVLFAFQLGVGSIADEEPQVINPRSLLISGLFAAALAFAISNRE